jgi:D-alanyl-lipoteichoic acid acyltransferase DltB (MBOAT superfamily)
MTVPSLSFIAFALVAAFLFNASRRLPWRQAVLLGANALFLVSFVNDWHALVPYAGFIALGAVGVELRHRGVKHVSWVLPVLVITVFAWLKHYVFVPKILWMPSGYLLVGLSFVFFRVLHLVIDGWEELPRGARGLVSYLNYTLNFTSIVSGPIQRYGDYKEQEARTERPGFAELVRAAERIVVGFFKVYIVSSALSSAHRSVIAAFSDAQGDWACVLEGAAVIGVYPMYLYFNFSGYTDFVIGIARLFSIELPENFDRPFTSANFITFWSRWHISLSQWLKTYVYNTSLLALMRRFPSTKVEPFLAVAAYFVTFFLVGIWHGQTTEFVFFGILQGGGVAVNKLYQIAMTARLGRAGYTRLTKNPLYISVARALTFTWFAFTLLWFWSSWSEIASFVHAARGVALFFAVPVLFAAALIGLELMMRASELGRRIRLWGEPVFESRYVRFAVDLEMAIIVALMALALHAPPSQIVYQAF